MATTRTKTLILFEDSKPDIERTAREIAERLDPERHELSLRAASEVGISELLASALFFMGAEAPDAVAYREVARVFKGINLAGRRAAFFGASGSAVAWLRGLCADTEVSAAHADLVGRRPDHAALAAWLRGIA
ncbi:MAG TPA: hypothetical protein VFL04_02505 [Rectinemataceae bacterium]|nr:hypothetical protein [Rectinemataceae bacterium]